MFDRKDNEYSGGNFTVRLRKEESSESLIKRFLKKMKKDRLLEEIMDRKHYKKPTTKKREAHFKRQLVLHRLRQKERQEMAMDD